MKKNLSFAFSGFILIVLIYSAIYLPRAILLYSGYCMEEKRYLTDQNKFDRVVAELIKSGGGFFPYVVNEAGGKVYLKTGAVYSSLRYENIEEFYALNPGCCEFVEYVWSDGILSVPCLGRMSGEINTIIRVFWIYEFDAQNNNQPLYGEDYFIISNCGQVWSPFEDSAPRLTNGF